MRHASLINPTATYDPDRGELELTGETEILEGTLAPLTIQVAAVQQTSAGMVSSYGAHGLKGEKPTAGVLNTRFQRPDILPSGKPDPTWEVRIRARFEEGPATAFGIQIEYEPEAVGALTTFTWAQLITIERDKLKEESPT